MIPANTPNMGGMMPPPSKSIIIESRIRIKPPFFLSMNATDHIVTIKPIIIASTPVKRKFGTIVIAGSPAVTCIAG